MIFDCFARCAVTGPTGAIETEGPFPDCPHPVASRKNEQTIFETRFGEIIRETPASPIQNTSRASVRFLLSILGLRRRESASCGTPVAVETLTAQDTQAKVTWGQ